MSTLGEAFIDIRARTGAFKADLVAGLKPALREAEAAANASGARMAASTEEAVRRRVRVEFAAYREVTARAKSANAEIAASDAALQAAHIKAQAAIQRIYTAEANAKVAAAKAANDAIVLEDKVRVAEQAAQERASVALARSAIADRTALLEAFGRRYKGALDAQTAAAKAAAAEQTAAFKAANAATAAILDSQLAQQVAAAKANAATVAAIDRELAAQQIALAKSVAAAEVEAYAIVEAAAKQAAKVQAAESAKAAISAKASAASIQGGFSAQFSKGFTRAIDDIPKKFGKAAASIPKDIFGAVTASAGFATIGVLGLGAALAAIGLKAAADLQSAEVAFKALDAEIRGIGPDAEDVAGTLKSDFTPTSFLQALRDIAEASTLAFNSLSSTSQQLLALGYNGRQARGIILTVGNALAASGKNGGQLNEDLRGVITAFSQIQGAGRLLAQDLNQITTRIPSATRVKVYRQLAADLEHAGDVARVTKKDIQDVKDALAPGGGGIDANAAVKSITKVLAATAGAAGALQRQNTQTLAGAFEGLKDTVRLRLGDAFKEAADTITKRLPDITNAITGALGKLAPRLQATISGLFDILADPTFVESLAGAIGNAFDLLTEGLKLAAQILPGIINGLAQLYAGIQTLATVGKDAFGAIGDAIGAIVAALPDLGILIGGAVVALGPILKVAAAIIKVVLAASPLLAGLGIGLALIGKALDPIADKIVALAEFLAGLVEFVGPVLKIVGVIAAIAAGLAVLPALLVVIVGLVAALTSPVSLAIIAVVALIAAFKKFQIVRDIVTAVFRGIAEAAALYLTVPLKILQILIDALGAAAKHVPFVGKALGGSFDKASDAIGGAISKINGAVDSIDNLRNVGADATKGLTSNIQASTNAIDDFNTAVYGTKTAALDAQTTVGELGAAIDKLPLSKRIKILVSIAQENIDFAQQNGIPLTGLEDATGFSNAGIEAVNAQIEKEAKAAKLALEDNLDDLLKAGGTGATDKAAEAAKKKAEAVKKRAETFRQAIRDILKGLDSDFKDILVNGTRKQIDTALDSLAHKIAAAYKAAGKARPDALIKRIDKDNAKLKTLADARDRVLDKLAKATARFEEVRDSIKSFGAITALGLEGVASAAGKAKTALADLSRLRIILPGQDTLNVITPGAAAKAALKASAKEFADALKLRLKLIQEFQANIAKLIAKGLNKQTIDEIISAGPEAGGGIANSLASASKATIDSINDSQKAIAKAGKELGNTAADSLFRAGKSVVDGLIAGLKDKRDEIRDAMKDIANALIEQIKKVLKIKSPSRVMHILGKFAGTGLHQGLTATSPAVVKAASGLADAAVPSIAALSVPAPQIGELSIPPMPEIAPLSLPVLPTIAPLSMPNLAKMAAAQAQVELAGALAPPSPLPRGTAAPVSTTTNHREIHAPITQHFNIPSTDPRAFAAQMNAAAARAVR